VLIQKQTSEEVVTKQRAIGNSKHKLHRVTFFSAGVTLFDHLNSNEDQKRLLKCVAELNTITVAGETPLDHKVDFYRSVTAMHVKSYIFP
jgi:hypothetical protein